MAAAGLATITMATSAATSASRSLLIELPSDVRAAMVPLQHTSPTCPRAFTRAAAGVCAHHAGCVDASQLGIRDRIEPAGHGKADASLYATSLGSAIRVPLTG